MKKYVLMFLFICCATVISFGQLSVPGYTHSTSVPDYTRAHANNLFKEWISIINTDLETPPTARETELYRGFVLAEGNHRHTYDSTLSEEGMWAIGGSLLENVNRMEMTKDLVLLENCILNADVVMLYLNPDMQATGTYLEAADRMRGILAVANWILAHPTIYNEVAPSDPSTPLSGFGTTYYERAKFYLTEIKKVFDKFEASEGFWEFDSSRDIGGWMTNYDSDTVAYWSNYKAYRAANPNGFSVDDYYTITEPNGFQARAFNRQWWFNHAYLMAANGLTEIDTLEQTSLYDSFYDRAIEVSEKCLNFWRWHLLETTEPDPDLTSYIWSYDPASRPTSVGEDCIHFAMDMVAMPYFKDMGLYTEKEKQDLASTLYSRHFDRESHFHFWRTNRLFNRHWYTGEPLSSHHWKGPLYGTWIAEHGTAAQVQGFVTKSLELFHEVLRLTSLNNQLLNDYMWRDDTRRTRMVMHPFQIYDAKVAWQRRHAGRAQNNPNAPTIAAVPAQTVSEKLALGADIVQVTASDADAGQQVYYWIEAGNEGNRFKINPTNGTIRVSRYYPLDTDFKSSYQLTIVAMDDGYPTKSARTTVAIQITDDNDTPVIPSGQQAKVSSNLRNGDPVLVIQASDNDPLEYYLDSESAQFELDAVSGILYLKDNASLQSENVRVVVRDPYGLKASATVSITLGAPFASFTATPTTGITPIAIDFEATSQTGSSVTHAFWDFGDLGTTNGVSVQHTYIQPGVYTVEAIVTDDSHNVDRISAPISLGIFEAEKASLNNGAAVGSSESGYTGSGYVVLPTASHDEISWTLSVPATIDYNLQFRYALGAADRTMALYVDGVEQTNAYLFVDTGRWDSWEYSSSWVQELTAGSHTITLKTNGQMGPFVDHLKVSDAAIQDQPAFALGSSWRYLDDGSNQAAAWTHLGFDDRSWAEGHGNFGYGDSVTTTIDYGPDSNDKYLTTYFRKSFSIQDLNAVLMASATYMRDDGVVIYINGQEVTRDNMPHGLIDSNTRPLGGVNGSEEIRLRSIAINKGVLRQGVNVIAVELHQIHGGSSDLNFDLQLDLLVDTDVTSSEGMDSDGDGVSDFLEDAFGTDPGVPDAARSKPVYSMNASGDVAYTVMNATPGYTYKLQRSTDLVHWTTEATLVHGDASVVTVDKSQFATGKLFLRIQVTK